MTASVADTANLNPPSATPQPTPHDSDRAIEQAEPRNLLVMAAHTIVVRIGWIFKTESIIMPAFLDSLGGAGWLRGCLPLLNRLGHSVPPLFFADRLRRAPKKRRYLAGLIAVMGMLFLLLAGIWAWEGAASASWMPAVFLAIYAVFFAVVGLYQLSLNTLQGKLIRANRRGRLMLLSTTIGALLACLFAWWLLDDWLRLPDGGFVYIFGFTGIAFVAAAAIVGLLNEPADNYGHEATTDRPHPLVAAWQTVRDDANFRLLCVVAMLMSTILMLFPHYQAIAHERLGLNLEHLMRWVVVQNIGTGLCSLLAGPVADRRGTRGVLTVMLFVASLAPVAAVMLTHLPVSEGRFFYSGVFLLIGLTPLTLRMSMNYTLEIAAPRDHPRYLSTLSLCLALPFCLSPLVGLLVEWVGFDLVLLCGAAVIATAAVLTLWLREPRHHVDDTAADMTED